MNEITVERCSERTQLLSHVYPGKLWFKMMTKQLKVPRVLKA